MSRPIYSARSLLSLLGQLLSNHTTLESSVRIVYVCVCNGYYKSRDTFALIEIERGRAAPRPCAGSSQTCVRSCNVSKSCVIRSLIESRHSNGRGSVRRPPLSSPMPRSPALLAALDKDYLQGKGRRRIAH